MQCIRIPVWLVMWLFACSALAPAEEDPKFELKAGDRVVFLGNSFFERAIDFGILETSLSVRWPHRRITFRNLGWDGDTVYGHSRAGGRRRAVFGNPEEGLQRLSKHVESLNPTVIFIAYGFNESFDGLPGLPRFRTALRRLIDAIGEQRRLIMLTPIPLEAGFGTELDVSRDDVQPSYVQQHNEMLSQYAAVIREVAKERKQTTLDVFRALQDSGTQVTTNGMHAADKGYRAIAEIFATQLGLPAAKVRMDSPQGAAIRKAIIKKNTLYFHRWRPRNDAFVYGERKDEQVIAQREPKEFEPLVSAQDEVIRDLLVKGVER